MPKTLRRFASLPLLIGAVACGNEPTGPVEEHGSVLVRLVEYPVGAYGLRAQGDYSYDAFGQLVRFDFGGYGPGLGGEVGSLRVYPPGFGDDDAGPDSNAGLLRTYRSEFNWSHDRLSSGRTWVRLINPRIKSGGQFLENTEIAYEYDARGRIGTVRVTSLLGSVFEPIHQVRVQRFEYDDAGHLVCVRWEGDAQRTELEYNASGDVIRERVYTMDGVRLEFTHTYDSGANPLRTLPAHGLRRIYSTWAELISHRNVVRTETRVDDGPVVAVREVDILEYNERGYPVRSFQSLRSANDPDLLNVFVAEYEYAVP